MISINAILNSRLFDHWLFHIYYNIVVSSSGVVSCPLVPDPESFSSLYYSVACSTNRIVIYSPGGFNCCWTTATRPKKTNGAFCSAFISSLNCTVDGVGEEASETIHRSASNYCPFSFSPVYLSPMCPRKTALRRPRSSHRIVFASAGRLVVHYYHHLSYMSGRTKIRLFFLVRNVFAQRMLRTNGGCL